MSGSSYERECKKTLEANGWRVWRSAGSFGEGDLVCLRPSSYSGCPNCMVVECKKTSKDRYYISSSGRSKEQFRSLLELSRAGYPVFYAVRLRGERVWYFFKVSRYKDFCLDVGFPVLYPDKCDFRLEVKDE